MPFDPETYLKQYGLEVLGFSPGKLDGDDGPKTRAAVSAFVKSFGLLKGDGSWPWTAKIDGDDIVVTDARGTCFGGSNDPQDSGDTASGIKTKGNPGLVACSLPMDGRQFPGMSKAEHTALDGSPIPKLPWKTIVRVTSGGKSIDLPVIDLGPHKRTGNAIDLTIAAAKFFNPKASATNFEIQCDFRIIGGAKYVR